MAISYYADRANLYRLLQLHPDWTHQQFADALGRSRAWVKKWRKRFFCGQVHEEPLTQTRPRSLSCSSEACPLNSGPGDRRHLSYSRCSC
jgi:hypothetical protein